MTLEDTSAIGLALAALIVSLRRSTAGRAAAKKTHLASLGQKYAALAIDSIAGQVLPLDVRHRAEEEAFRIVDTTADGKRDFDDRALRQFLDAERNRRKG